MLALLTALITTTTLAQVQLEAKSFTALISEIEASEFEYVETGKMFGFVSTKSCMYRSDSIIVFRNYCFPLRPYPAQGYTIFSREYGVIKLYEETVTPTFLKRDIDVDQFPALLAPYLTSPLPSMGLTDFFLVQETMYANYFPGCWSTNFSFYSEVAEAGCSIPTDNVNGFNSWAQETQTILNDESAWVALMNSLNRKFIRR